MSTLLGLGPGQMFVFTLVLCRLCGLILTAPFLGTKEIPLLVRGLLAIVLALLLAPLYWGGQSAAMPDSLLHCLLLFCGEGLIGAVLGMGVSILLSGALMAGGLVTQASGMSLSEAASPGYDDQLPVFSHFLHLVTLAVFLTLGGHRLVVVGLLETFRTLPPGTAGIPTTLSDTAVALMTESFQLGVRAAAPAVISLLLSTILLGIIGRAIPQLNVFAFGFGLNVTTALLVLSVSIGAAAFLFNDRLGPVLEHIQQTLHSQR